MRCWGIGALVLSTALPLSSFLSLVSFLSWPWASAEPGRSDPTPRPRTSTGTASSRLFIFIELLPVYDRRDKGARTLYQTTTSQKVPDTFSPWRPDQSLYNSTTIFSFVPSFGTYSPT